MGVRRKFKFDSALGFTAYPSLGDPSHGKGRVFLELTMQIRHKNAHQIIKEHYGLNREPTHREVFAEIANIKRKEAKGNLDDRDEMLASMLSIHGHLN